MTAPASAAATSCRSIAPGAKESKVERDYFAIHAADVEDVEEEDDLIGYVHSYEVGSTVDGPGLRFVAFLSGCLLRCQYCHNPDTWHKRNGHPVTVSRAMQADRQVREGAQDRQGRRHAVGRRADGAAALHDADLPPLQGARAAHLPRHLGPHGRPDDRSRT